ncbi:MAG TPA: glycosyltransferase family 4 protein [Pseudobacteroides sp.]|nr:glycosyltransferase family 4 protein [Pseudobacteroides sp.]
MVDCNTPKKVLMLGNSRLVIFGFRGELIERLVADGYRVTVSFPNGPFGEGEEVSRQYGCEFVEIPMNRRGTNPIEDLRLIYRYVKLIKSVDPDVVLAYTVKCDIYGGIACRLTHKAFMPNITGLGKGLVEGGVVSFLAKHLYRFAVKKAKCIFFQNEQDREFFLKKGIKCDNYCLLPGSGVNLTKFKQLPYPTDEIIVFTYIARVMKAKGIEEYLGAAQYLKGKYSNVEFHICGFCEEDYKIKIQELVDSGTVVYHGLVDDVTKYVAFSHCIVLPTFHPEGISNVLLEGAACGRPLITTNRAGCRETVIDGVTGYLIKERDTKDLIEKMECFISLSNEERAKMGMAGRLKIENEFDRQIVVEKYCQQIADL